MNTWSRTPLIFMSKLIKLAILIHFLAHSSFVKGDTIDVWLLKINDEVVFNSNLNLINSDQPMTFSISGKNQSDTLKIYFWTDSGQEKEKWSLVFKDSNDIYIGKFTNPIDSTIKCFPPPCTSYPIRKCFVLFVINDLKLIMMRNQLKDIYIEFEHSIDAYNNSYLYKKVCVISE